MSTNPNYDPITAVAQGCCLHSKDQRNLPEEQTLFTVVENSINLVLAGGKVSTLVAKDTKLPVKPVTLGPYLTAKDNQTEIEFELTEGESKYADWNDTIDTYKVTGLTPKPKGEIKFTIKVEINNLGDLKFTAIEMNSQNEPKEVQVKLSYDKPDEVVERMKQNIWEFLY